MRLVVILVVLLCGGCGTVSVAVNYNDGPTQSPDCLSCQFVSSEVSELCTLADSQPLDGLKLVAIIGKTQHKGT